jgi:RNA polymerase sigma factor for flagellar operon FliA
LGISVERLRSSEAKAQPAFLCSLESVYSESNLAFADSSTGALGALLEEEERDMISSEIAKLPKRHALVLQLFFHEQLTLAEIGAVLGVCPARVCQIKRKALERIRRGLQA